jgi:hypothetical protein
MAPNWMATSNSLVKSLSPMPNKELAMIICPVEEIGKNSVSPSTTAMIIASKIFIRVY